MSTTTFIKQSYFLRNVFVNAIWNFFRKAIIAPSPNAISENGFSKNILFPVN